jgi:Tripartite tricarboxylate transporter TctB family
MKFEWRNNRDFLAGLVYIGTGMAGWWMALDYPFGSALRMGPGYFPIVLSGMMIAFGIAVLLMGVKNNEKVKGNWSIRAMIILPLAAVLFGILMEEVGFIPALAVLIPAAAASGREFKWLEVVLLTIGLIILSLGIFIWGLGLPYQLIKGVWGY